MGERFFRRPGKWAKLSGKRGAWCAALGWEGHLQAFRLFRAPSKLLAETICENWVRDGEPGR